VSALPPFFAVNYYFRGRMKRAGEAAQERTLSWASRVSEHIAGLPQLIALGQQRHRTRLCFSANAEAIRGEARRKTAETEYVQASTFVATIALSALILFGGLQVLNGSLTIGGLVAFYSLQSRLIDPLYAASDLYARVQRGSLAVRNMMGFLRLEPTVADPPSAPPLISRWKGAIRIENVSLRYDNGRLALDQVDLRLNEGEHIALTGANGAGKSTLSKLIARLCDPTAGTVVLDDVPLTQILLRDVRRLIRYVPQHVMLWNGSIEENVRLGHPSASRPELDWAASLSGLDPVLMRSPKGWRENVGPGGSRLSGGERQRVVLARSILARPRVLLLDEATAAMDTSAEQEILRELDAALHDTTCVLISHRLSSIPKELPLIVMGDGRILPSSAYTQPYGENSSARANV